jgi:peptidyl-tRNA hydrolase ICT1
MASLKSHVPKILHPELRGSRYYVSSSDSILIQSDAQRSQSDNKDDTRRKFNEELRQIYKNTVPGVTSPEQKSKVEQL